MNRIIKEDIHQILKLDANWEKLKNKTVLITGATGMIGQYIVFTLLELNNLYNYNINIFALCRNKEKAEQTFKNELNNKFLKFVIQEVEEEITLENKINYIIHTASPANPKFYSTNPVGTIMANTIGTRNTLELARKNEASYCYISSMEVYGKMDNTFGIKEDEYGAINSLDLRSCYPASKNLGENMCVAYKEQYGIDVKIIRPAHTYGPGMSINDPRVQCEFMKKVLNNKDIIMKSDGSMQRTYTHVADVASGTFFAILKGEDITYNAANEDAIITIRELAETIISTKEDSKSKLVIEIQNQEGCSKIKPKIMNCDRLKKIGWKPLFGVKEGLKRTMEYHMEKEGK